MESRAQLCEAEQAVNGKRIDHMKQILLHFGLSEIDSPSYKPARSTSPIATTEDTGNQLSSKPNQPSSVYFEVDSGPMSISGIASPTADVRSSTLPAQSTESSKKHENPEFKSDIPMGRSPSDRDTAVNNLSLPVRDVHVPTKVKTPNDLFLMSISEVDKRLEKLKEDKRRLRQMLVSQI